MKSMLAQSSVGSLVRESQNRAFIFERFGIDYCCHGNDSLEDACSRAEVRIDEVVHALDASDASVRDRDDIDYSTMALSSLIDDIVKRHHAYLRERLPALAGMIDRVVAAHSKRHMMLLAIREVFESLRSELTSHMMKEERVLFPIIIELERAVAEQQTAPQFHCGSVTNPIGVMESEHITAGEGLSLLRRLTEGYSPPDDACVTYRTLFAGLRDLEADLHLHIHKENNILFPRAVELESSIVNSDADPLVAH